MFSASKTAAPASGAYQISNSVRFRSAASAYFSRTPSVAGNRQTWTWSGWVKRGTLGASQVLFDCDGGATDTTFGEFGFNGTDAFEFIAFNLAWRVTSQVFRDPSAWYHLVVVFDTTQATAANRVKIYVNGYQITAFSTSNDPAQNTSYAINQAAAHNIAKVFGGRGYFDGYLADINFIDGQALTPSSFGQINPTTGVWQPIKYAGTYGTNGFHLAFNNGTSTTTLGNDSSGNGNNWTPNNISLTAGSTYDWMLDSPTPYAGTSYGVGNYAVFNPISNPNGPIFTLSGANLNYSCSASAGNGNKMSVLASIGMSSGKWYCEATEASSNSGFGVASGLVVGGSANGSQYAAAFGPGGALASAATYSGTSPTFTTSDVIGLAFDAGAKTLTIYKNGTSLGSFSGLESTVASWFFIQTVWTGASATSSNWNFGQRPFSYTPPSGYKTLCTQNLPSPTIQNGAAHMAATLYTGNGSTQSIVNTVNGVSFQPDFVWIKRRNLTANHQLYDSIRGVQKALYSDLTSQELTQTGGITAFLSNGITVGSDAGVNGNGDTQVAWNWKAGGTAVTNTAGSITSQVSANTTAGFSVVTYTCQSSGSGTIGHGLGVAPSMIISKGRGTVTSWGTYHVSNGWNGYLVLNGTNSFITDPNGMNNTAPTSSVWTQGTTYAGIGTMVAYCFAAIAGYSAFGSYTGNGSADGPFVFLGFRPRWVMLKSATQAYRWYMLDSSRNTYNVMNGRLFANSSDAEQTNSDILNFVSNGIKVRTSDAEINGSGQTIIYAAFAENPFQNALAR